MYVVYLKKNQQETISLNEERERENEQIEQSIKQKQIELNNIIRSAETQNEILQNLNKTIEKTRQNAKQQAQECYNMRVIELNEKYKQEEQALKVKLEEHNRLVKNEELKLDTLRAKQSAYLEAQKRQQEIEKDKNYYRLALDNDALDDIALLRDIQKRLIRKEAIDKVIYEVYYKPAYDILMPHLFSSNNKVSGIYKITDLITGQTYIGQSVDMRERFRQHVKKMLSRTVAQLIDYIKQ